MSSGERPAGDRPRKVVVTGIAGRLGQIVAQSLHRDPGFAIEGLDRRPFPRRPKDLVHHEVDLRSKKAKDVFRHGDVDALIHLGLMHDPRASAAEIYSWNVGGTSRLLEYCQTYRVPKLVVLSSANVYGPRPDNPQFLTEDAPLLAAQRFPQMRDLVEIDHLASTFLWKAREVETVILRPVHILGTVHNAPSNYLRLDPVPTLFGFDPMVQVVHERDVARAVVAALAPGARGIYNIVGPGQVPLSAILTELGRRTVPIPHPLAKPLWAMAFRLGASSYPVAEFDFIRYVCMVDGSRAKADLGYAPRATLRETIRAVDEP
ncbi:MAG: NAD-dependent epimerase/dehydratase family protein [Kofleriaceae bacterium]|jgi:UDP-glucose 4-epimerase|nr:NAD-dependent epimerase/dehydratase family protein [Kofleriaceae bacterium]MBP9166057.1 NAD-dependent epimerase/dehydratase family protein [Kofleriaceae bacterium]MBP9857264.1 NAD-dependent epimerase/dehydratase family protein [Kofleriaceae bacterium]